MKLFRRIGLCLLILGTAAGCEAISSDPTPTALPTEIPALAVSATPLPTPTIRPRAIDLTRASDPAQQAFMRIIHASPDTPPFDVYIERLAVATNLAFTQSTQPSGIVEGDFTLRVVSAGTRPDAAAPWLETTFKPRGEQSLIVIIGGSGGSLSMSVFSESHESLRRERSRITFIHAVQNGPEISVDAGETPLTPSLAFGQAAVPVVLPAEALELKVHAASAPALTYPIQLKERTNYTLIIVGRPEALSIIQTENRAPGSASIRIVNAAPVGAVDIYLDEIRAAAALDYTRASERIELAARIYAARVYTAGSDPAAAQPLANQQLVTNDDDVITLILMGEQESLRLVESRDDSAPTPPNRARVAFVNALASAPRARVETEAGFIDGIGDLSFGQPPQVALLEIRPYEFTWYAVGGGEGSEIAESVLFEAGRSYLYLMTGRENAPPLIFSERVGIDERFIGLEAGVTPTAVLESPTRIRFVNALSGTPIAVSIDGEAIIPALAYGDGTDLLAATGGEHSILIRASGSGSELVSSTAFFEDMADYTLVIYGVNEDAARLQLIPETGAAVGDTSPYLRLLNLTSEVETRIGLAYSPTAAPGSSHLSEAAQTESFRQSLSLGINRIPGIDTASGRLSGAILAPAGLVNLYIVDITQEKIAATIAGFNLEAGKFYDVFAFQHLDSPLIEAFVLPYPVN